ncbi:MAG: hypothetical protein WD712_03000 [Candidatus Spechtbacterales bacterium]
MSALGSILKLKKDFLSLSDILKSRGIMYGDKQGRHLISSGSLSEIELEYAVDKNFIVLPGPDRPMNLVNVYNNRPQPFYKKFFNPEDSGYFSTFNKDGSKFALEDVIQPGWYMLSKDMLEGSTSKTWSEQLQLLADDSYIPPEKYIPNAAELAWCLTTYALARGTRLLYNSYVRTLSQNGDGNRILMGRFDKFGLRVTDYKKDNSVNIAGIVPIIRIIK